ncbi:MAG TPA: glutamyl-tRNA reductase [Vicinamibacterales bacterium]|nr:glutamyl-tRNA reductase [Vicinamibacterales bacterium]
MSLRLFAIGVNHRTAPIEVRERVDFARNGLEAALAGLAAHTPVREMAVLSTCNRAEVYAAADSDEAVERVARFFGEYHGVSPDDLNSHLYVHRGAAAARHLFRVAAGLDSLIVGEPQILGQVKAAYTVASEQHYTGTVLNRLFHLAFAAGKRVRSETGLGEGAVSVSYAAISLAKKIFGDLSRLQVLILGSGAMGKLTAVHLRAQGVAGITIASRTRSTADRLAQQIGATACDWSELENALIQADIVVTATGAPTVVLTRADLERAMKNRRERPLFVIDIAVPRDVDPAAGTLDEIFLYNVDDLKGIIESNLEKRTAELARADAIVSSEAGKFATWLQSREIIPTVVALRDRFESIRRAELNRLQSKLTALPPEAQMQIDHITRLIVEKLLLTPTEQLKAISDDSLAATYSDALNRLFSLPPPADPLADEPVPTKTRKVT